MSKYQYQYNLYFMFMSKIWKVATQTHLEQRARHKRTSSIPNILNPTTHALIGSYPYPRSELLQIQTAPL